MLHRIGFEAFVAAAGFKSVEDAVKNVGTGAFVRASMHVQLEAEPGRKDGV